MCIDILFMFILTGNLCFIWLCVLSNLDYLFGYFNYVSYDSNLCRVFIHTQCHILVLEECF